MLKIIPVFLLLFTVSHRAELCPPVMFQRPCGISWNFCFNRRGYLCNAQSDVTWAFSPTEQIDPWDTITTVPPMPATETDESDHVPAERSLPTVVLAGVSIALVLLCVLIVGIFWYSWKKSQEGSMVLNPIPYGEAGVSLKNPSVPGSLQEWPSERAVP